MTDVVFEIPVPIVFSPQFELLFEQGSSVNPSGAVVNLSDLLVVDFQGRSFTEEKRTLRALSYQMLPQFVFDQYPTFVEFAETFLDFVEKKYSPDGMPQPGPYHILKNLLETADIDKTEIEFVRLLKIKLGRDLPASTAYDLRTFLKHIKDFYLSKGTENSIQFFFRSVFNTFSRIYLPKVDLVRASYNTWYVPYVTQFKSLIGIPGDPPLTSVALQEFFDASLYGQTSKQTAWLGGVKDGDYIEILAHSGEFTPGETVTITKTDGTTVDVWIPIGGIEFLEGSFLTDDGMPSSTKRLQDSNYWQEFSYDVISPNEISDIINPLVMNVHPAGFKIFARVTDENPSVIDQFDDDGEILIIRSLVLQIDRTMEDDAEDPIVTIQFPLSFGFTTFVQSYVDVGEFFEEEDTLAFSLVYPNISMFDQYQIAKLERDEPEFNLFVSFGGYKLPPGNESIPGYVDNGARVFSYSDQTAHIGFGGFTIETMENLSIEDSSAAYCRNLARRHARSEIITLDYDFSTTLIGNFTAYGSTPIDSDWSNGGTSGKVALVFHNGKLIKQPLATVSTEVVDGFTVSKLDYNSLGIYPRPWIAETPLFEILYLSEIDMGGNHGENNRATFTLSAGQTVINWDQLPSDASSLLVFKNGWNLIPHRDFRILGETLVLLDSVLANDVLDVFILQTALSSGIQLTPVIGDDEPYDLIRPVDAPLEIIPSKLKTAISECLVWWTLERDTYDMAAGKWAPVWGTAELGGSFLEADYQETGPFDNLRTPNFGAFDEEMDMASLFDPTTFIPVAGDPFTVNVWIKFTQDASDHVICWFGESLTSNPTLEDSSLHFMVDKVGLDYRLRARCGDGLAVTDLVTSLGAVYEDVWFMVSVRYDGTNLKLDCRSCDTSWAPPIISVSTPMATSLPITSSTCNIGEDGVDHDLKFIGTMAHFALWNVALRDHELDALFNNRLGLDKPVYYI